ncbi:MAG: ABC transporter substrate-binding protein, partial [Oscillospiraceae bacterium]|nr:ABC transporter substrate-binding protein [Oscillospiraceae bacterium]
HDMAAGGALEELPDGAAVPAGSGGGFFPLGARLPLLLRDPARMPEAPASLEALLGAGEQTLAADSWADLLYEGMYALGRSMSGLSTADSASSDYVRLHNLLARAAYDGAIVNEGNAADCVKRGLSAAAAVDSMSLVGTDAALCVDPLPLPAGAEPRYAGVWMGFAVTKTDTATARFLQWLSGREQSTALALSLGLVPFEPEDETGATSLEEALLTIGRGGTVSALDPGCSYLEHRDACEERLRLSLDLLA